MVAGPIFRVLLDGRDLFKAQGRTFTEAGKLGLWTKAHSVAPSDDFRWDSAE